MKANPVLRTSLLLACLLGSSWASAATFSVNSYVDSVDANTADGICADADGFCTLRAAILQANALAGADTILAPPGVYDMTIGGANEDGGTTGDLDITADVTIIGLGTTRIASQVGRVIHVLSGNVSITGLTLTLGDANNDDASGKAGGAVHNSSGSTLTLNNCTVIQNTAQGGGGGIYNGGTLTLNASTMTANSALGTSKGGAVFNAGTMTITNSTLSGNSATDGGGGIFSAAGSTLIMNNVTVVSNTTSGGSNGGGISIDAAASATLSNTILGNNQASGTAEDCLGTVVSLGGNLVEVTTSCVGLGGTDVTGVDPVLGPLQNNGGRTFTHALLESPSASPAIDAGVDLECETTDQRGLARPQGLFCDIGSFELFPNCPAISLSPLTLPDGDPGVFYTQTITPSGGVSPYTFAITSGSLPPGLALNTTTGVISGVPTTDGSSTFTVTAFDDNFCAGSQSYTLVIGIPCNDVTITLSPPTLPGGATAQNYSQQVTADGGTEPYQYTITNGSLPPDVTLNLSTGVISGSPSAPGTYFFVVTATDLNLCTGSQAYVIDIDCFLDIQPETLPGGTEGVAYSENLSVTNGTGNVTFAVISGSLPTDLSLTGAGVLSGTPTVPGTYTFVIEATDENNCTGSRGYTVVIDPCLVVSPDTLADGIVGTPYSQTLTAAGGTPPIDFTTADPLPDGLGLSITGTISGTPTTGGISLFTVDASDQSACTTSKDYSIVINPVGCPAIAISPTSLPDGEVGQNYNQNLTPSGGNGPYTFTFLTGDLPSGVNLDANGNLSGTPIESGIFEFTVAATDDDGCTGTETITLAIYPTTCPLIVLFPSGLPDGQVGSEYSEILTATGGAAPYAYTITVGSLPLGLSLDSALGLISGTPTDSGSFSFTVKATDDALCFGSAAYTVDVVAGLFPAALDLVSDATGVWEPLEAVTIAPSWTNGSGIDINGVTGTASTTDVTISLTDTAASYGNILIDATASCVASANCYGASSPGPRPADHWDAVAAEALSTGNLHDWTLHIGESFPDVATSHDFYRFVETIFHHDLTPGCGAGAFCPENPLRRDQLAVLLLRSKLGSAYVPPPAVGTFGDVPADDPFAPFVEDLFNRGIVSGCSVSPGLFCPDDPVTREQLAVALLKTLLGSAYTPPTCPDPATFDDVPCGGVADWIYDLSTRGITLGCGNDNFCPSNPVTRGQLAAFLTRAFELLLYAP